MQLQKRLEVDQEKALQDRDEGKVDLQRLGEIDKLLSMSPEREKEYIMDQLFIETGEDIEDIFLAFKHYGIYNEEQPQVKID